MTTWTSWSVTNRARQLIALSGQMMIEINSIIGKDVTSIRVILPSLCNAKWFLHHLSDHLTSVKSNDTFISCFRALTIEASNRILGRSSYSIEKVKSINIRVEIEISILSKTFKIEQKNIPQMLHDFLQTFLIGLFKIHFGALPEYPVSQ